MSCSSPYCVFAELLGWIVWLGPSGGQSSKEYTWCRKSFLSYCCILRMSDFFGFIVNWKKKNFHAYKEIFRFHDIIASLKIWVIKCFLSRDNFSFSKQGKLHRSKREIFWPDESFARRKKNTQSIELEPFKSCFCLYFFSFFSSVLSTLKYLSSKKRIFFFSNFDRK